MTGSPLNIAKRLQFNLDVEPVAMVDVMKDLRRMVMPLFWVEEQVGVDSDITDKIKSALFLLVSPM